MSVLLNCYNPIIAFFILLVALLTFSSAASRTPVYEPVPSEDKGPPKMSRKKPTLEQLMQLGFVALFMLGIVIGAY